MKLGILGPRGLVGEELLKLLETKKWANDVTLISTQTKVKGSVRFKGKTLALHSLDRIIKKKTHFDLVLSLAEPAWAKGNLKKVFSLTKFLVDESSAFRLNPDVPLIIPEINGNSLSGVPPKLIASPNCTTSVLAMAIYPVSRLSPLKRVIVASYQAASGGGRAAKDAFLKETKYFATHGIPPKKSEVFPQPLVGNVFPYIGELNASGFTEEEDKVIRETRKILGTLDLEISATCVRVPVVRSHSLAIWIETEKSLSLENLRQIYKKSPGIILKEPYPTPQDASGKLQVFVGRLRNDPVFINGISLWASGDNLIKGAALNVLQIAELLLPRGLLRN